MRNMEAVAGQMEFDGMPGPDFDRHGYTDAEIANARRKIDEARVLLDKHPDMLGVAVRYAMDEAATRGHIGVRYVGELLRRWLWDTNATGMTNDAVAVLARFVVRDYPWMAPYFELRPCALDVVLASERT